MLIGKLSVGKLSVGGKLSVCKKYVGQMFVGQMFRLNVSKPSVRLLVCRQNAFWPIGFRPKGVEAWKLPKTKIRY